MIPARRRGGRRDGFTLIEVLVALIVFAVVAVVTQRGIVTTRLGLDRAQSTLAAEQVARSIVETELPRLVRGPGEFEGQANGLAWTIRAEPIVLPLPPAPPPPTTRQPAQQGQAAAQNGQNAPNGQPGQQQGAGQPAQEQDIVWRLLKVSLAVANGRGRPLTVETLLAVKDTQQ